MCKVCLHFVPVFAFFACFNEFLCVCVCMRCLHVFVCVCV